MAFRLPLFLSLALAGLIPWAPRPGAVRSDPPECRVGAVADGDTFSCRDGRKVRLTGIDAPELGQGRPGGRAREALRRMLPPGEVVRLERDVTPTDRYGRILAYVWARGTLVNEAMIRQGWAVLYTVPPNVKYAERFRQAQNEARTGGAGLWSEGGFECLPRAYRRRECLTRS